MPVLLVLHPRSNGILHKYLLTFNQLVMETPFYLGIPDAEHIVISGDIHGDFNALVYKLCVQYKMRNTLLIVAGDCGFGFEKPEHYKNIVRKNSKRLSQTNNWIVFVRGNHDNPAYFDGNAIAFKRFIAVPDYSVIQTCNRAILVVGGGISIDRVPRIEKWKQYFHRYRGFLTVPDNPSFAKNFYWENEPPVYNEAMLEYVGKKYEIDTVVTHTAPSFCELISKGMVEQFAQYDPNLLLDVQEERKTMDAVFHKLIADGHPLGNWYYGHFHQSWNANISGVHFKMLDIMEFAEIRPL